MTFLWQVKQAVKCLMMPKMQVPNVMWMLNVSNDIDMCYVFIKMMIRCLECISPTDLSASLGKEHMGVHFPKASLANYGRKFHCYQHRSVFWCFLNPWLRRTSLNSIAVVWLELQLSSCGQEHCFLLVWQMELNRSCIWAK